MTLKIIAQPTNFNVDYTRGGGQLLTQMRIELNNKLFTQFTTGL